MSAPMTGISGDASFLDRLSSGTFVGRIHSVFRHTVNLRRATDNQLYTLGSSGADNAPATLVVDTPAFDRFGLCPRMPIVILKAGLAAGGLSVSLDHTRPWSPLLASLPIPVLSLHWMREFVDWHGVPGGIKPRHRPASAVEAQTALVLAQATRGLSSALRAHQVRSAHDHGGRLIGLGPGLTPAGDDYVLGIAVGCALLGARGRHYQALLLEVIDANAHRTNDISYTAMAHAVRGRVRESIIELAKAMASRDSIEMAVRAHRVLALGATSGTDILSGMLAGLQLPAGGDVLSARHERVSDADLPPA